MALSVIAALLLLPVRSGAGAGGVLAFLLLGSGLASVAFVGAQDKDVVRERRAQFWRWWLE